MDDHYSIQTVSQITGLSPHVIRAWEKRYGAVEPSRSDGNQRLYSENDVQYLKLLAAGVRSGHRIGQLVGQTKSELSRMASPGNSKLNRNTRKQIVEDCLNAVKGLEPKTLEDLLVRATIDSGILDVIDTIIVPLMDRIGEEWHKGRLRISKEHMASSVVRTFLGEQLQVLETSPENPAAVVATPVGQIHELGSLAAAIAVASAGYRVIHLGSDLPASEVIQAVLETDAALLLVSIVFPGRIAGVRREMNILREHLPRSCRMIVGGASATRFLPEDTETAPHSMQAFHERILESPAT